MQPTVAMTVARHALVGICHADDVAYSLRELAIILLCNESEQTIRGLASTLDVSKGVVSRTVTGLEDAALVVKREDPIDGRNVYVRTSADGLKVVSVVNRVFADAIRKSATAQEGAR